jgi:hypothetical protein
MNSHDKHGNVEMLPDARPVTGSGSKAIKPRLTVTSPATRTTTVITPENIITHVACKQSKQRNNSMGYNIKSVQQQ